MIGESDALWFDEEAAKEKARTKPRIRVVGESSWFDSPLPVDRLLGFFGDGPLPPLARAVLKAWTADKPRHNRASLSIHLAGATFFRGPRAMTATRAYLLVVDDALGCLIEAGLIVKDGAGWYVKAEARAQT